MPSAVFGRWRENYIEYHHFQFWFCDSDIGPFELTWRMPGFMPHLTHKHLRIGEMLMRLNHPSSPEEIVWLSKKIDSFVTAISICFRPSVYA